MKILVVAPHPDDETLGVGGTILRYKSEGHSVAWLIVTNIQQEHGFIEERVNKRASEINKVTEFFNFDEVFKLEFPTTKLDMLPIRNIVEKFSEIINNFCPDEIFVPHLGDIHTDHKVVHNAVLSCTKWFRYPFIKKILAYETISETEFGLDANQNFSPNVFIDISKYLDKKISAMKIYSSEIGEFPFPRSRETIESLARIRGSSSGFMAAEAFQLLRERVVRR